VLIELSRISRETLSRLSGWPRRMLLVVCLALAVWPLLVHHSDHSSTRPVVVAISEIKAGAVVSDDNVRVIAWPTDLVPMHAFSSASDVIGHRVAGSVDTSEPITRARLVDNAITAALHPGEVAMAIRIANAGHGLVSPGMRIDVYSSPLSASLSETDPPPARQPLLVARGIRVLASSASNGTDSDQLEVVVAIRRTQAPHLTINASGSFLATLVPPSQP